MPGKVQVDIQKVSLAYGSIAVLRNVSLTIEPGEFFALLGPSGSGKSTLLRLIAGFNSAQAGRVLVDGRDISQVPPWRRDIGMVFQNYALWPHMTVWDNVAFGLQERRLPKREVRDKVAAALARVGLTEFGARRPNQLSGGQQQRVALARTIAIEPLVLLLDEPLSNLDAQLRVHMRAELLALQRNLGITTIFVTHDQEEALSVADRVAVLDQGVIQQVGTPVELYDAPANRFIASFVGTINLLPGHFIAGRFESAALGTITLPASAQAAAAGPAHIAIRPHGIKVAALGAAPDDASVWLEGTVQQREFLGEFVRYRVQVAGSELIVDQPHLAGAPVYAAGQRVKLGIDPAQTRLLRD